jgi:formylglycine-generating enzyme required for sulfatase activity
MFRVIAADVVEIVGLSGDGWLSWNDPTPGALVRVEVADGLIPPSNWAVFTHVLSDGPAESLRVFDPETPPGFSFVPAGTYTMGSPTNELGRFEDEVQHQVTLTRYLHVQKTEVTNRQMADVLNWALEQGLADATPATVQNTEGEPRELLDLDDMDSQISWDGSALVVDAGREEYPCVEVTWHGAQAYCDFLSDREGLNRAIDFTDWSASLDSGGYRLPTEAEWEYACRAATTTALHTGELTVTGADPVDPNLDAAGWYAGNSANPDFPIEAGRGTHPTGLKQPNSWGLLDMHGNVYEWCADWHADYSGPATDPEGPPSGTVRVFRGGSWYPDAEYCRAAFRGAVLTPTVSSSSLGFRPVR